MNKLVGVFLLTDTNKQEKHTKLLAASYSSMVLASSSTIFLFWPNAFSKNISRKCWADFGRSERLECGEQAQPNGIGQIKTA